MIDAGTKNGEIRRGPRLSQFGLRLFDHRQTADAGTDHHADTLGILVGDFEAAVLHRLDACSHAVMDERIHVARFLAGDVVLDIEALHLAGETRGERRCIELRDIGNTRLAGDQSGPGVGNSIANRRNAPRPVTTTRRSRERLKRFSWSRFNNVIRP